MGNTSLDWMNLQYMWDYIPYPHSVLTPYVEMDLQQPHIYFDVQIYTSTHRYGY